MTSPLFWGYKILMNAAGHRTGIGGPNGNDAWTPFTVLSGLCFGQHLSPPQRLEDRDRLAAGPGSPVGASVEQGVVVFLLLWRAC